MHFHIYFCWNWWKSTPRGCWIIKIKTGGMWKVLHWGYMDWHCAGLSSPWQVLMSPLKSVKGIWSGFVASTTCVMSDAFVCNARGKTLNIWTRLNQNDFIFNQIILGMFRLSNRSFDGFLLVAIKLNLRSWIQALNEIQMYTYNTQAFIGNAPPLFSAAPNPDEKQSKIIHSVVDEPGQSLPCEHQVV